MLAKRDATVRNHNNVTYLKQGIAGLYGAFEFGGAFFIAMVEEYLVLVLGAGLVAGFPIFAVNAPWDDILNYQMNKRFRGIYFIPYSSVDNYNPKLNYPDEIRGLDEKKLYKYTYLKQARKLAKQSMSNGPEDLRFSRISWKNGSTWRTL